MWMSFFRTKRWRRIVLTGLAYLAPAIRLIAQSPTARRAGIDTTDARYRIGREIGDWLPVSIILLLALLVLSRLYRRWDDA